MSRLWLVVYDISDNRIRYRVADLLKNHGLRVQYSVFECYLTDIQLSNLRKAVAALLIGGDSVRWYPLCRWCRKNIGWQGVGRSTVNPDFFQVV